MRWTSPFGAGGAACFTVCAAFKVVTGRLDRARRLQVEGRRIALPYFAAVVVTPDSPVTSSALLITLARVFAVPRPQ